MNFLFKTFAFTALITISNLGFCQTNAGFENGDFTNWTLYSGEKYQDANDLKSGANNDMKIVDKSMDPNGAFPTVLSGNKALKLGGKTENTQEMAGYTFTVTNANKNFVFNYAAVFQDGGHESSKQPYFLSYMTFQKKRWPKTTSVKDWTLYYATKTKVTADKSNPFFTIAPESPDPASPYIYRSWTCIKHDLSKYVGEEVTIWFITSDCNGDKGPHTAYAYVDGLFESNGLVPSFTIPDVACQNSTSSIILDGSASQGEKSYLIEIQECNQAGVAIPGTAVEQWFVNQPVGTVDLRKWYTVTKGKQFKCNTIYKVKLAVSNDCDPWQESTKFITIRCAQAGAGADKFICCNSNASVTIGTPEFSDGYQYSWSSSPTYTGGYGGSFAPYTVKPNTSTTFTVVAIGPYGCVATDQVDVFVNGRIEPKIDFSFVNCPGDCSKDKMTIPSPCKPLLTANTKFYKCDGSIESTEWTNKKLARLTYLWNTGETTKSIYAKAGVMNYSVTVSDGCTSVTKSFTLPFPTDYYSKPFPSLNVPSGCNPDNPEKYWVVGDGNDYGDAPNAGEGPAYHAFRYKLTIYDYWGHVIRCSANCSADGSGLKAGEIKWDGRSDDGNIVEIGPYYYRLVLWNCNTADYGMNTHTYNTGIYRRDCEKWGFIISRFMGTLETRSCKKYKDEAVLDHIETKQYEVGTITVVR